MLIIRRQLKTRQRRVRRGDGLSDVIGNTIKSLANKITGQKVVDAVVNGGTKIAGESAAKGAKLAAESIAQKIYAKNKKTKNKKSARVDTIHALINGSGIIYE